MKNIITLTLLLTTAIGFSQTKDEVYIYLLQADVKEPDIVLKQCFYESAHLTSPIFLNNNNLFGMKEAKQRETTALGTKRGHAYYKNWKKSVDDYKIWQRKYYKGGDYYDFLVKSNYCPNNEEYINTLKNIRL